jgi:hypothetical protein
VFKNEEGTTGFESLGAWHG